MKFLPFFHSLPGTAIVTGNKAAMWTDARYFLQADMELDCNWTLMKEGRCKVFHRPLHTSEESGEVDVGVRLVRACVCPSTFPNPLVTVTMTTHFQVVLLHQVMVYGLKRYLTSLTE